MKNKDGNAYPVHGYKGFNNDLKCRDFQYEVGGEYETVKAEVCERGFHLCENPLDVLQYYPALGDDGKPNRYCEVEGSGELSSNDDGDTKIACTHIKIGAEIQLKGIIDAGIKFIFDRAKKNKEKHSEGYNSAASATGYNSAASATGYKSAASATGDNSAASATGDNSAASATGDNSAASATGYKSAASATGDNSAASATGDNSAASATGDNSAASATGYKSAASATGDNSAASATGYNSAAFNNGDEGVSSVDERESVAVVTGCDGKAKGALGCWIVLTERGNWDGDGFPIKEVKAFKVDGKKIKAGTFYKLVDGKAVAAE